MRLVDQLPDVADRDPGFRAAGIAPALDGFENRFGLVAGEGVTDIDHQQRRALAETAARAIARRGEDRLVAFGQKLVPDRFGHHEPLAAKKRAKTRERKGGEISAFRHCSCQIPGMLTNSYKTSPP